MDFLISRGVVTGFGAIFGMCFALFLYTLYVRNNNDQSESVSEDDRDSRFLEKVAIVVRFILVVVAGAVLGCLISFVGFVVGS